MDALTFTVDQRLLQDNHIVFADDDLTLLINQSKVIPWLILVPNGQGAKEWFELNPQLQHRCFKLSLTLAQWLKDDCHCDKINTAAIGNVVSQLHIHVVGRRHDDVVWPGLVWGAELPDHPYTHDQLIDLRKQLEQHWYTSQSEE